VFIFIRLTAGVLAGLLVRGHGYDVIGDIVVGVIYDCTTYLELWHRAPGAAGV
jgi:uncharacterized membrane protein YeaQ/YmgE (transglycosylase-associated protein family)